MLKKIASLLIGSALVLPFTVTAQDQAPAVDDLANKYFGTDTLALTDQERAALALTRGWEAKSANGLPPVAGPNGAIQFVFGAQQASVVCAVLQVCDIALQPGEEVNSVNYGDTVRWSVEPAFSGVGVNQVVHLIVKAKDVGLETSLVVNTTRRTYHIRLRSHRTEYMPQVSYVYPDEVNTKWQAAKRRETTERSERTLPETGEYLGDLDFEYDVRGSASWAPVRVYNDGRKTILEMPASMAQTEAPTLLVVREPGGLFSDEETVMVNSRLQGRRFIVDSVFDRAVLVAGVGNSQQRVTITRRGK